MKSWSIDKETGALVDHDTHLQPPDSDELPPVFNAEGDMGQIDECEEHPDDCDCYGCDVNCDHLVEETVAAIQELGKKYDSGKLDWTLLPFSSLEGAVRVLMFGAEKYDRENWKLVKNGRQRYTAACLRHLLKHMDGEEFDPETGLRHTAHAMVNLLFIEWLRKEGK